MQEHLELEEVCTSHFILTLAYCMILKKKTNYVLSLLVLRTIDEILKIPYCMQVLNPAI